MLKGRGKGKVPILILAVLILLAMVLSGGLYYFLQKERMVNLSLNQQLREIQDKQVVTEAKLEESKKMISAFEVKLKENQAQIGSLTSDLEAEKSAKQESLTQVERLQTELEQQKLLRADLEKRLGDAQGQIKKSQEQFAQLETKKTELEEKVKVLETKSKDLEAKVQGIELGTIVINPEIKDAAKKAAKKTTTKEAKKPAVKPKVQEVKKPVVVVPAVAPVASDGSVLVVNKDYNFVVINLGAREGIKAGSVFSVFHNDKYIGDVKVEKVHESMSAAGFVSSNIKEKIFEGDKVVPKT